MSLSLPCDKPTEIQQLAYALLLKKPVTVSKVMSFLGKTTFCANDMHIFAGCARSSE